MPLQQGISQEVYCHRYIYDSEAYHTTANAVLQTALNVTGRGKAQIQRVQITGCNASVRITVDGIIVVDNRAINFSGMFYGIFDFNTSLLVEHRSHDGLTNVAVLISYCVN